MENIIADTRVRTAMQASIDWILSERGLSDLFYSNYVTDFYLIVDETYFLGLQLVIERMGNKISVIYDSKVTSPKFVKGKHHKDVEMTFHMPSWQPLTLEHNHFIVGHKHKTIENTCNSNVSSSNILELDEFSRTWASIIRQHKWENAIRVDWGYRIDGVWHRGRIRER
jgi:hypothetical protein